MYYEPEAVRLVVADYVLAKLDAKKAQAHHKGLLYGELFDEIGTLMRRGGKRLRPQLVMLGYLGCGGLEPERIVPLAASQELLHTFLLIHDDIIDRADRRWGGPTIEYAVRQNYRETYRETLGKPAAAHYGRSLAMLAGDVCLALVWEVLGSGGDVAHQAQYMREVHEALLTTLGGEVDDVMYGYKMPVGLTMADILRLYVRKTAVYSFCLPLRLGALAADASTTQLRMLTRLGLALGTAYQLRDDLLDMFADSGRTGKPSLGDIREGKLTMLIYCAQKCATMVEAQWLQKTVGNRQVGRTELMKVRRLVERCGARAEVEAMIASYANEASVILSALPLTDLARKQIQMLIGDVLRPIQ